MGTGITDYYPPDKSGLYTECGKAIFDYGLRMNDEWRTTLIELLKERGIKPARFSQMIGKSPDYVRKMLSQGSEPSIGTAQAICRALDLPLTFFFDGEVDNAEVMVAAQLLADLTPEQKETILAVIRTMHETRHEPQNDAAIRKVQKK